MCPHGSCGGSHERGLLRHTPAPGVAGYGGRQEAHDGAERGTDRIDPHHEERQRSTFNRFAGLGTLGRPENA